MLELRSERATIPLLIEVSREGASRAMSVLDPRIPPAKAQAFARALSSKLELAPVRAWMRRVVALGDRLVDGDGDGGDHELAALIEAWRAWPEREGDPSRQLAELPAAVWTLDQRGVELPRAARAALILHRFARGEVLDALTAWEALPQPHTPVGFTEHHLDAVALGLLGRRAAAAEALTSAEAAATEAEDWLAIGRAHEALDQRDAAVAAHQRVIDLRGDAWDQLRLARVRGDFGPGEPIPRPGAAESPAAMTSFVRELVKILEAGGRYDDTLTVVTELLDQLPAPAPADLVLRCAQLHLWRREGARARARLATLADPGAHVHARLIEGALLVLDGDPEAALEQLADPRASEAPVAIKLEALLWKAEAQLALGQPAQALACVDEHIILENSLAAYLLKLVIGLELEPHETLTRSLDSRTFLDGLIRDVLPTLCAAQRIEAARGDAAQFAGLIRELLDDMGGNRGSKPTWCRSSGAGVVTLAPIEVRLSGRDAAVANLIRIRTDPPAAVLAGFDAVQAEYPLSPHPCTYRGELLIWLGRYDEALASFEQGDGLAPTRWSYVGRAAVYDLIGEAELADRWTREGIAKFGELTTATSHVYRGERLRKSQAWPEARRDLEIALEYKTRRIGARINLALVYQALGETAAWERELERLRLDAPAFLWEAGARAGALVDESTLLAMLDTMVGNRSSFLHTMIDSSGEFRVIPEPSRWIGHARLTAALARRELERVIAARWLGHPAKLG